MQEITTQLTIPATVKFRIRGGLTAAGRRASPYSMDPAEASEPVILSVRLGELELRHELEASFPDVMSDVEDAAYHASRN